MKYTIEKSVGKNIEGEVENYRAFVEMNKRNLTDANLSDANLTNANLTYANLTYANLTYANLTYANLTYANLTDANLAYANLADANLTGANLTDADLRHANLSDANLAYADLRHANLTGADLDYATIFTLRCSSFGAILDKKEMAQQAYHFCRHKCADPEVRAAQLALMPLANQFHRVQECGELTAEMFESEGK